jgi:PAS domain S-box-containing protein
VSVQGPGHPFNLERLIETSRALVSALPEATVLVVDHQETVRVAEGKLLEQNGHPVGSLIGRHLSEFLPPSQRAMLIARHRAALGGETQSFDYRTMGDRRLCWIQLTPIYFAEPTPAGVITVIQDLTLRHSLTAELHSERERRQDAEKMAGLEYWEVDVRTGQVVLSAGARRLLGRDVPELSPTSLLSHFDAEDRPRIIAALSQASEQGLAEYESDLHSLDGVRRRLLMRGTRRVAADGRAVIAGLSFDITQLRDAEAARGESEALFRQGFDNSPIGMVLTDPVTGRYLEVNDAFCRLLGRGRDDLLALSFHDVAHPDDALTDEAARAQMAAGAVAHYECEKRYVRPDGSVVWTSAHTVPVYHAGGEIRGFFCQVLDLTARKEREEQLVRDASDLERLEQTRSALAEGRLVLHGQPIIDLETDGIVALELLVRLRDEQGGIVPPGDFLPVAERYGLIREIDQWVTDRAVELAATGAPVEVNLSAALVGDEEVLETIRAALERTGADPALVIFEVTETALMADIDRGRMFSMAVRDLGCRFALDDFGTGYGTFTYLKHIPIDFLKIDIEFVRDLLGNRDDERLVRAIVAMARDLGKTTIAEGVEDAATLERLRELGVDQAQGYHIGRPAEIVLPVPALPGAAAPLS